MVCAANMSTPISTNSYFATTAAFIGTSRSKRSSDSQPIAIQRPTATSPAVTPLAKRSRSTGFHDAALGWHQFYLRLSNYDTPLLSTNPTKESISRPPTGILQLRDEP